ncbi:MAG TPA: hypothetical protein VFD13_03235 [Candidatus Kapabacteria bacterium]|nr:hypothetical protein [Candidatus Kapabacteria bacterium]
MVFLSILKSLSLGVWLGALIMLGYAVAGPIFQQSPSKTLAGAINGIILGRMNNIEWVCWAVAFACSAILLVLKWNNGGRTLRVIELAVIIVTAILLWSYSFRITSKMEPLRATIGDFDHPRQTAEYTEAKAEFDSLHHAYTMLVSVNMVLILGAFVLSAASIGSSTSSSPHG